MLKKRVIPVLLLKNGRMVKGKKFKDFIDTGDPNTTVKIYSSQDADEIVFLNISKDEISKKKFINIINEASKECSMPLTVGGGITNLEDVKELIKSGADKVVITTHLTQDVSIINDIKKKFGSQCIVAGIDYSFSKIKNKIEVLSNCGQTTTNLNFSEYIINLSSLGVGEIFLNSIDNDGIMRGYDLKTIKHVNQLVDTPIIACGGAGKFDHIVNLFKKTGVSAAACSSLFHFNDYNPIEIRSFLNNNGIKMRILK